MVNEKENRDLRSQMIKDQLVARGIVTKDVLDAMRKVPRELFVPKGLQKSAYLDSPLSIGKGQTISQPYMVAVMIQEAGVSFGDRVLEIGTGSGYAAAVLSYCIKDVYTVERVKELTSRAKEKFKSLAYDHIHIKEGDGSLGWKEFAPYDAIIVTAGGPDEVPASLIDQLAIGGRLIIPLGGERESRSFIE